MKERREVKDYMGGEGVRLMGYNLHRVGGHAGCDLSKTEGVQ